MTGRPVPPPPPHIAAAMTEAGRTGDKAALNRAHAAYIAWLVDNGHSYRQGNQTPDGAWK